MQHDSFIERGAFMTPDMARDSQDYREGSTGAQMSATERGVMGALGVGVAGFALLFGGPVQRLVFGTLGVGIAGLAVLGRSPLATALKIRQTEDGDTLVSDAVTVDKSPEALYAVWRDLAGLPRLMTHLERVEVLDERRSHWTVKAPAGTSVSWDAELTADEPGRRIAWQSLPGATIQNSGEVLFSPAPGDRGTEVVVRLAYKAPGGTTGAVIARMAGQEPSQQLRDDLMRFKREQEIGFAPTTEGQTSGRAEKEAEKEQAKQARQEEQK